MKTLAVAFIVCLSSVALANESTSVSKTTKTTRTGSVHATDQGSSTSDLEITRTLRQKLASDKTLSTMGKNVTIVTRNGLVTVRGTVSSQNEQNKIQQLAREVSGKDVTDQMTISR